MHMAKKKILKKEIDNKDVVVVMKHSQQQHFYPTEDNTNKISSPKATPPTRQTVHKYYHRPIKDLGFLSRRITKFIK
jgi:hypothetical protein